MGEFVLKSEGFNNAFEAFVFEGSQLRNPLILVAASTDTESVSWQTDINPDNLRTDEKEIVSHSITHGETDLTYVAIYDLRKNVQF